MPPRKSTDAKPSTAKGADDDTPARGTGKSRDSLGIEDLTLPRTMIQRLAKGVLPANTQIQKDALLAIHKSATVFVSYLADSANDRAILANKKTIQPKDVLEALAELEFEGFLPRCEAELNLYNTIQCTKRNDYRRRVKVERETASESVPVDTKSSRAANGSDAEGGASGSSPASRSNGLSIRERDSPPAAKKARVSLAGSGAANGDRDQDDEEGEEEDDADDDDDGRDVLDSDDDVIEDESRDPSEDEAEDENGEERYGPEGEHDRDEAEADGDESE